MAVEGLPVFTTDQGFTNSHQFAIRAADLGGGQAASKTLRRAGFLACGIGLPINPVAADMNGLRFGTPELSRWGMNESDAPRMARLITAALGQNDPESIAAEVSEWCSSFDKLYYVRS